MDSLFFWYRFSLFDIEVATSFSYPAHIAQLICSSIGRTNGTNGSRFFLTRKKLSIRWNRTWEAVKANREALSQKVESLFRVKQAIGSFVSSIDVVLFSCCIGSFAWSLLIHADRAVFARNFELNSKFEIEEQASN